MASCYKKIDSYILGEVFSKGTDPEERIKDVQITYLSNGEIFANSPKYKNITQKKIELIRAKLDDYTKENKKTPKGVPIVYTFFDMTREVEEIVYKK